MRLTKTNGLLVLPVLLLTFFSGCSKNSGLPELPTYTEPPTTAPVPTSTGAPPAEQTPANGEPIAITPGQPPAPPAPSNQFLGTPIDHLQSDSLTLRLNSSLTRLMGEPKKVLQGGKIMALDLAEYTQIYCEFIPRTELAELDAGTEIRFTNLSVSTHDVPSGDRGFSSFTTTAILKAVSPYVTLQCHKVTLNVRNSYSATNILVKEIQATFGKYATLLSDPLDQSRD